jgi:trk system potassium uptake protein TrkA
MVRQKNGDAVRIVFIGAGEISLETAKVLGKRGHEVVIIETDKAKIAELAEKMDCSFLHGDGSRPDILREVSPERTDILFCLTGSDQANVIASLVGRSLGFKRVVTSVRDEQFENICHELGLKDIIVPYRTISRHLEDMVSGSENLDLSTVLKGEARFFSFIAKEEDAVLVEELALPEDARVVLYYRDDKFAHADARTHLRVGDEVVILTHSRHLAELEKRWEQPLDAPQ